MGGGSSGSYTHLSPNGLGTLQHTQAARLIGAQARGGVAT